MPAPSPATESAALATRLLLCSNALATGVLLGILQWGIFFVLQSFLAATAIVYLLATSVWLLGSLAGLALPGRRGELLWLAGSLGCYYLLRALAARHPYSLAWLPALLPLVAATGAYAGRFFRARSGRFRATKWLFLLENTGFVGGMVFTAVALYAAPPSLLARAPLYVAALVAATALLVREPGARALDLAGPAHRNNHT